MSDIKFTNIWENAAVSQRCIIVHGESRSVGSGVGSVIVWFDSYKFPAQRYPLVNGFFRALVPLQEGANALTFETDVPNQAPQKATLNLKYLPIKDNPPVHFCLLMARDSPGTFDSMPYRTSSEGNGLPTAVKKLRMASYMMSAYTMEQMNRNGHGLRSFTPYSEFEEDTISARDHQKRMTTHIHVVRLDQTVAEIRDANLAQQNSNGNNTGGLFGIAHDALRKYGGPFNTDEFVQAACIFLDAHWDTQQKLVLAHAALGGGINNCKLAIFGSHAMWSWPSCLEDLPTACLDETRTDTNYVINDANQSGTAWEALCIGMGAFQHEIGHLLGCPHQPDGIMLRGYLFWTRSFSALEGYSSRDNKVVCRAPRPQDEDHWNRLDIQRFLYHPSFALPNEKERFRDQKKPLVFASPEGITAQCAQGIYMVDFQVGEWPRAHYEYNLVPEVTLSLNEIKNAVPREWRGKPITMHIYAAPKEEIEINNVDEFVDRAKKNSHNGVVQSSTLGEEKGDLKTCSLPKGKSPSLVRIFSGLALDGIEFIYPDGQSVMFGNRGGSPKDVPIERNDEFVGIALRSGLWVDAAGVITRNQRSPLFGGGGGGSVDLLPPKGHRFAGLRGWYGNWCNGIAMEFD